MKTTQKNNAITRDLIIALTGSLIAATVIFVLAAALIGSLLD
jgi:hypothetical protein